MSTRRWAWHAVTLAALAGATGCTSDDQPIAAPTSANPVVTTPAASPSAVGVDSGSEACKALQGIQARGYRASPAEVYRAGELGADSANRELSRQARLMADFAAAASTAIQAGGDAKEHGARVRGMLDDVVATCRQYGYLPASKRS